MDTRRTFLKKSALGVGSLAMAPTFASALAEQVQDGVPGALPSLLGGVPRRFVFIRKSNGIRPDEVALPSFTDAQAKLDKDRKPMEVDLRDHELPEWLQALSPYKDNLSILQQCAGKSIRLCFPRIWHLSTESRA